MGKRKVALYHAFHTSLPIMAGYGFLGLTYDILVHYLHHLVFSAVMLLQRRTKQTAELGITGITLLDMLDWILIHVASHLESAYHITTVAKEGWSWTLAFHSFYKQRMLKNIKKYVSMGYIGFKRSIKRYSYPIFSVQSSVFSLMFSIMRHRVNKYLQS